MRRRYPFAFTCLAVATAPFTGVDVVWFFSLSDLFLTLAIGTLGVAVVLDSSIRLPRSTLYVTIAAVSLLSIELIAVPNASNSFLAFQWARTRAGTVMMFLAVIGTVESLHDIHVLLRLLACSLFVVAVLTVLHSLGVVAFGADLLRSRSIFGISVPFQRTLGVPMDYGNFGMYMSLGIAYLVYESVEFRNQWAVGALPVLLLAVLISQSRSTWAAITVVLIGMIAVVLACRARSGDHMVGQRTITLLSVGLFPVGVLVFVRELIRINPATLASRVDVYQDSYMIYMQHPLNGIGRATYVRVFGNEVVHNGFLSLLVSFGPLALLLFGGIYLATFFLGVRQFRIADRPFLWGTLLAAFFGVSVELMLFDGSWTKILWLVVALIVHGGTVRAAEDFTVGMSDFQG